MLTSNISIEGKCDVRVFYYGIVVTARWEHLRIFIHNKKKNGSSVGRNAFFMREVTGHWPDWFELTGRLQ